MDAELLLWLRAAPWPLGSLFGSFHHAERAPRVTSSLTAESPTIRSFQTSLVSIQRFSPPVFCAQGRLVNQGVRRCAAEILIGPYPDPDPILSSQSFNYGLPSKTSLRGSPHIPV